MLLLTSVLIENTREMIYYGIYKYKSIKVSQVKICLVVYATSCGLATT